MSLPYVPAAAEERLDWLALTEALAAGHLLPKAEVADCFLYRGADTLLNRSAWIDGLGGLVKVATIFPGNAARGLPSVNGSVTLYSDVTGEAEAMLDFQLVTKWKTAGDSLLAARRLADPAAKTILILGAGKVAAALVAAFRAGFPRAGIRIWNRTPERAEALAREMDLEAVRELPAAVEAADIVLAATMSKEPVLKGEWLRPGQHVNLIGAFRPDMREADDAAMSRARVYVDSFDTTLDHIGELILPLRSGALRREDVLADFRDLAAFRHAPDAITLFKNGGGAHLDLMTSRYILDARKAG